MARTGMPGEKVNRNKQKAKWKTAASYDTRMDHES